MMTEQEMHESTVPTPKTPAELAEYVASLVRREHDYGTCVYAMSMAAVAAFNYVANELGVTGFQASCADMDILRRTRNLEGPAILMNGADLLYPQYDLPQKLSDWIRNCSPWLAEHAQKKLTDSPYAHPDVIAHWRKLTSEQSNN